MQSLSIVIPAYNEEKRLPRTFELLEIAQNNGIFKQVELKEILIVDDGSTDNTANLSENYSKKNPHTRTQVRVLRVQPNQGKGNAIHTGMRASTADLILIADADSATPWDQFVKLQNTKGAIAIGSRDLPESDVRTSQSWIRENMGKTFNFLVRLITGLPFRDTQCGFKLIERKAIQPFLDKLKTKRFAWDVEFLMFARAHHLTINEVAVAWEHQAESHVNAVKDSIEMLLRVIQMRFRIWFCIK